LPNAEIYIVLVTCCPK